MHWLIGLDEAGYGPNLGPLAIGATAWALTDSSETNLYELLANAIINGPTKDDRLPIADSKLLYQSKQGPKGGLALLERSVFATLRCSSLTWTDLLVQLQADESNRRLELPWHEGFELELPLDATVDQVDRSSELLEATMATVGARIPTMQAR